MGECIHVVGEKLVQILTTRLLSCIPEGFPIDK